MYYLANLPTLQKKLRVMADRTSDIFFKRDVTMLKTIFEDRRDIDVHIHLRTKERKYRTNKVLKI
jgi:hypothetical protein